MESKKYQEYWQHFLRAAFVVKPELPELDQIEETINGISEECQQIEQLENRKFWNTYLPKEPNSRSGTPTSITSEEMKNASSSGSLSEAFASIPRYTEVLRNETTSNLLLVDDSHEKLQKMESLSEQKSENGIDETSQIACPPNDDAMTSIADSGKIESFQETSLAFTIRNGVLLSGGCCNFVGKAYPNFVDSEVMISSCQIGNTRRSDAGQEKNEWIPEYSTISRVSTRKRAKEDDDLNVYY